MALEAEVRAKNASKLAALEGEMNKVQTWIEAVTQKPFAAPFADELKDGSRLCEFINVIKAGTVRKINTSKLAFKQMENITNFIKGVKGLGLLPKDVFDTIDLYEQRDMAKVVLCLTSFGALMVNDGHKYGFEGPHLETTIKFAKENRRSYTPEQLAQQRALASQATAINQGSAAVMERSEVTRTGITFGNDQAGSGSAEMSAQTAGSAGVMERKDITKTGITFGNDQAGSGSTEMSAQTAGSAGVMERHEVQKTGITFGNDQAGSGSAEMSAQTAGSAGVMERKDVAKTGITFGNDQSGAGSTEATAVTAGSAGVMARSEVQKTGITFGNDQAGAGSADQTAVTAGSAGVMERSEVATPGITFGNDASK